MNEGIFVKKKKKDCSLTIKSFLTREARIRVRRLPLPPSSVASRSPKRPG